MRVKRAIPVAGAITLSALLVRCSSFDSTAPPLDGGAEDRGEVDAPAAGDASVAPPDGAVEWIVNHHSYLFVLAPNITYEEAKVDAIAMGGHLVTLTRPEEEDFVFRQLMTNLDASFYRQDTASMWTGPWLGAERIPDSGGADAQYAWTWVTHEPFTFADWTVGEPTDQLGLEEPRAVYLSPMGAAPTAGWADVWPTFASSGYVVEFE
jgi:hypothetical protein